MSGIPPHHQQPGFSNYPRATNSSNPYQRPPGVYFDFINLAWNIVKSNLATWVASMMVGLVLMYAIYIAINLGSNILLFGSVFGPRTPSVTTFSLSMLVGMIPSMIINVFQTGLMYMGLKAARNETIGVGDVFSGFRRAIPIMIGTLLMTICIYLGVLALIIGAFFVAGALAFVPLLILDRNLSPLEAIQVSFNTLKSHAWAMFALMFVTGLLSGLGMCLCGVGFLFTAPIYFVTMGLSYNTFFPPVGMTNYQHIGIEPPR